MTGVLTTNLKKFTPIRYYIALLCLDIQIKVIWNYCRYGITDSTLKGTVVISCFDKAPSSPILEIDPLFKIRCMSPLYHNNRAKLKGVVW